MIPDLRNLLPTLAALLTLLLTPAAMAQRQMEKLGRGLVVLKTSTTQTYLGWRLLATDPDDVAFNVYRSINGGAATKLNASPITTTTDFSDTPGSTNLTSFPISYFVKPVIGGVEQAASPTYTIPAASLTKQFISVPLQPVTGGTSGPYDVKYVWVGDFDGDGEYDYLVDRLSTLGEANQYLQAYKRDGTFLWQMDMGPNSVNQYAYEPGASAISIGDTDNVTVYDMDGDGKAEVMVRTANGVTVTNALGAQVANITAADNTTQYVSVFNGLSGVEMARTPLPNPWAVHGTLTSKCAIAYLDGVRPSVLFYGYNRADTGAFYRVFNTFDYRDGALTLRWTSTLYQGEGHQIRIADVDHDGKDEICDLGFTIDDDGSMLFNTELRHGDRFHVADMDPDRPGLETFAIQQLNTTLLSTANYESGNGKMIRRQYNSNVVDVGRGDAGDFNPNYLGMEMFSTQPGMWGAKGNLISQPTGQPVFPTLGLWWDADFRREFMSGANATLSTPTIDKWIVNSTYPDGANSRLFSLYNDSYVSAGGVSAVSAHQAYGGRPGIIADLFGDWREESIEIANDYNELRIYTTKIAADSRLYCLMQNAAYRMQATCKGYYQSNFTDYYLGIGMQPPAPPLLSDAALVWNGDGISNVWDTANNHWKQSWFQSGTFNTATSYANGQTVLFDITGSNNVPLNLTGTLTPASVRVNTPKPYTFGGSGSLGGPMNLTKSGGGALTLTGTHGYTGATLVAEGALIVNGSLTSSPVTVRGGVWLDGAISGTGTIGNGAVIEPRGSVSPGNGTNSVGTLTISGSLIETDAYNLLDVSNSPGGANDLIAVQGNLNLSGTNILQINPTSGTLSSGTYTLITYTGTLTGGALNLTVKGLTGVPYSITAGSGSVKLIVNPMRAPGPITWAGTNANWNLATTSNWLKSGAADVFVTGDAVTFDNTGAAAATVTMAEAVLPASVTINSTVNYTFAGTGYLSGTTGLTKSGSGALTISTSNDFTGPVSITGGVLAVSTVSEAGAPGGLGAATSDASNLTINGGTLRFTGLQSVTDRGVTIGSNGATFDTPAANNLLVWQGLLTGSGPFTKSGSGTLILNGTNTYIGATTISGGTVALADDTTNRYGLGNGGTGTITISNGTLKMFDDSGSYNATYWTINVPAGGNATLLADSRCELRGALTGSGTFNYYVPFIRTDLFGNWSAFTGQINFTTDADGGDFRIQNTFGYGNAHLNLTAGAMYYTPSMGANLTLNIGALSGASGAGIYGGPTAGRTLTWSVGGKNLDTTYAGAINNGTGTTAFTKVGTGTQTLSGTSTYTGATTVSGGTLSVTGALGATDVTVANGAAIVGSGTVGGQVTLQTGATLGSTTGQAATLGISGGVTLSGGSKLTVKLGNTTVIGGGTNDLIQMTGGALNMSGTITVTPAYLNGTLTTGTYTLIAGGTTTTGSPTFIWGGTNGEIVSFDTSTPGTLKVVVTGAGPPNAPTGITATAGNAQVALNWNTVAGATSYKVKRSLSSGTGYVALPGGTTASTAFNDTGLTNGTTYYYQVSAANGYGDGPDSSEASATPVSTVTATFTSIAAQDGYARESNETSNVGGSNTSNTTLRIGDDDSAQSGERQLKAIVSFDTSSIPDNAVVTSATLRLKASGITGTNPFTTHGTCYADIRGETGFGGSTALASGDFEAAADASQAAVMSDPVSVGGISTGTLNGTGLAWINKTANTQLRLYFSLDDNNDGADDWIDFHAGDDATAGNRPVLELTYYIEETSNAPTAWLKFDESSGTTAADSSGNGWNGTLANSPTWVAGKINNAVSMNGTAHVSLPTGVVNTLTDFTISTWVKLNTIVVNSRILDFGTSTTPTSTVGTYMFVAPTANGMRFAITTAGYTNEQQIIATTPVSTGTWTHVAVTLSGTTGTFYVNGTAVGTNTGMTLNPASLGNTTRNFIGRSQFAADPYLNGTVDEFRIYNRALSPSEISGLVAPPAITSAAVANATNGTTFNYQITATNSPTAYDATGLPAGLNVNPVTGLISGSPSVSGTFNATVSAANASGNGSAGLAISVLPNSPPTPSGLVASGGNQVVSLSWNASAGATSYTVSRSLTSGSGYVPVVGGTTTSTSYNDTGLDDSTTYHYVVSATNGGGTSTNSNEAAATTFTEIENWRMLNFGTTADAGNAADSADPDGDGSTNAQEFTAGTDPKSGASFLKIDQMQASGSDINISFATVTGRIYHLRYSADLQGGSWFTVQDNIPGTGGTVQIPDINGAGLPKRFYQLSVEQTPGSP